MVSIGQSVAVLAQGFPACLYARCCPQSLREHEDSNQLHDLAEDEPQIPGEIPRGKSKPLRYAMNDQWEKMLHSSGDERSPTCPEAAAPPQSAAIAKSA